MYMNINMCKHIKICKQVKKWVVASYMYSCRHMVEHGAFDLG